MKKEDYCQDEIDLKEVFKVIWEYRLFIIFFTLFITNISIVYVVNKNHIPIYQGKLYMQIGQIQDKNFAPVFIENTNDLAYVLNLEYDIKASIPKGQDNILEIIYNNEDKNNISETLIKVKDYVLEKHKNQTIFYEHIFPTKQIGNIKIEDKPINNPKRKLIVSVSFVSSLILSMLLVFILDFIKKQRVEF